MGLRSSREGSGPSLCVWEERGKKKKKKKKGGACKQVKQIGYVPLRKTGVDQKTDTHQGGETSRRDSRGATVLRERAV